jgi:hypothetical protein
MLRPWSIPPCNIFNLESSSDVDLKNPPWNSEASTSRFVCLTFLAMLLDSQSRPSYKPSPEVAHVLWIYLQAKHTNQCSLVTDMCHHSMDNYRYCTLRLQRKIHRHSVSSSKKQN